MCSVIIGVVIISKFAIDFCNQNCHLGRKLLIHDSFFCENIHNIFCCEAYFFKKFVANQVWSCMLYSILNTVFLYKRKIGQNLEINLHIPTIRDKSSNHSYMVAEILKFVHAEWMVVSFLGTSPSMVSVSGEQLVPPVNIT